MRGNSFVSRVRRMANRRESCRSRKPSIERLEDRTLLATVTWDGGGVLNNWSDPLNWDKDAIPGEADTAVIDLRDTFTVTLDVNATVEKLLVGGTVGTQTLDASNHTLKVALEVQISSQGVLTASGTTIIGDVRAAGSVNVSANSRITGRLSVDPSGAVTIGAFQPCGISVPLTVDNGVTNEGTIELRNRFACGSDGVGILNVTSGTFVNAAGGKLLSTGTSAASSELNAALDNRGTMQLDRPLSIQRSAAVHANSGTIHADGGGLS